MRLRHCLGLAFLCTLVYVLMVAPVTAQPVTIEFSGWPAVNIQDIIDRFNQEHTDIHVEFVNGNSAEILTRMAAGTGPDVFRISWAEFSPWALQGLVMDLTPYIERDSGEVRTEDIWPAALTPFQLNGRQMAMPHHIGGNLMYLNLDHLASSGLAVPADVWTWEEFAEIARRMTLDRNNDGTVDVWGFGSPHAWQFWIGVIESNGTRVFNADQLSFNFDNPGTQEAMQYVYDLINVLKGAPGPSERSGTLAAWTGGEAAMVMSPATAVWRDTPFEFTVMPNPTGSAKRVMPGGPQPLAISPTTEHPEAAWEFIKWVISPEIQEWISNELKRFPPARRSVVPSIEDPVLRTYGMELENQLVYTTMIHGDIVSTFNRHLDAVLRNEEAITAAAAQIQHELTVRAQETLQ